jgi:outer membrane scaffolding protein for murein synthesis (MipA/OmpV family)
MQEKHMSVAIKRTRSLAAQSYLAAALAFVHGAGAAAQEDNRREWDINLGVGAMIASDVWTDTDNDVAPGAYFEITRGNWQSNQKNLVGYQFTFNERWNATVGVGTRADGYDRSFSRRDRNAVSDVFDGYKKRDTEAVFNYSLGYDGWLSIDATRDVSGKSYSNSASLSVEVPIYQKDAGLSLSATASTNWYDSNYVNYYYGISDGQIDDGVGRGAYKAGDAVNYEFGLTAAYPVAKRWTVMASLTHTELDSDITDSPLVDTNHQNAAALVLVRQF